MTVDIIKIIDLSDDIYNQLYVLNDKKFGTMKYSLAKEKSIINSKALAFCVSRDNIVIGWALLVKRVCYSEHSRHRSCSVYVDSKYRRRGVGTELIKAVSSYYKSVFLMPIYFPNIKAKLFFDKSSESNIILEKQKRTSTIDSREFHYDDKDICRDGL